MIPKELCVIAKKISIQKNGCWYWIGTKTVAGYGRIQVNHIKWLTHRYVAWKLLGLSLEKRQSVIHSCDNPSCCNPAHLLVYDRQEEIRAINPNDRRNIQNWIINGKTFIGLRPTIRATGLSQHTLMKYTDRDTRIFDVEQYRTGCMRGGRQPKF